MTDIKTVFVPHGTEAPEGYRFMSYADGGNWFREGNDSIAERFGIPEGARFSANGEVVSIRKENGDFREFNLNDKDAKKKIAGFLK